MTPDDIAGRPVSRETLALLNHYGLLVAAENRRQNLVSASTLPHFWDRHVVDSLQLLRYVPKGASVCDIGSGAGLPGIVIACTREHPVTLVEPRRLRAEFLTAVVRELGLQAEVVQARGEAVMGRFDVITARAVAPLDKLLAITRHLSHAATRWVFPKGRNAQSELEVVRRNWHCDVGEVPSVTDPDARIVTLASLRAKVGR